MADEVPKIVADTLHRLGLELPPGTIVVDRDRETLAEQKRQDEELKHERRLARRRERGAIYRVKDRAGRERERLRAVKRMERDAAYQQVRDRDLELAAQHHHDRYLGRRPFAGPFARARGYAPPNSR